MKASKLDYIISTTIFFIILFFIIIITNQRYSAEILKVKIISNNKISFYPLEQNRIINLTGPVGNTTVEIKQHQVRVIDSDCKNKICVNTGWISRPGQTIVCVPNKIVIELVKQVESDEQNNGDLDAVTK